MHGVKFLLNAAIVATVSLPTGNTWSQDYPVRPVRLVTLYAAGSGSDDTARFVAAKLSELLKQTVIVDNKGGAGGLIATQEVLRAQPPGYSLLLGAPGILTNLFVYRNPQYKWEDLTVLGVTGLTNYAMIIHTSVPARNIPEFVTYAKANPGKLNYGSLGPAGISTILVERLKEAAGIDLVQIPFKGGAPLATALLSGDIHVYFPTTGVGRARIQNPQIVALAVTGQQRSKTFPDLPTFKELGYPALAGLTYWDAVFAPSATPRPVIQRLQAVMVQMNALPEVKTRLEKAEKEFWTGTLEEFNAFARHDGETLAADFRRLKIPVLD